jgi:predicted transcriptional regulator
VYEQDLADRMEDMDPQLRSVLRDDVNNFVKLDVARFFVELSREAAALEEIAEAVGREPAELLAAVNEMVRAGLLGRRVENGTTHYVITQERRRRSQLERFVASIHDRDFRLKVIYHLLRSE